MIYLNQIMQDELKRHHVLIIDSRKLLGTSDDIYNDYLIQDGKSVKMRTADGIHFSVKGQKVNRPSCTRSNHHHTIISIRQIYETIFLRYLC